MLKRILVAIIVTVLLSLNVFAIPVFQFAIPLPDGQPAIDSPVGVFVDSSGNIYLAIQNTGEVMKLDSSGNVLLVFGGRGNGDGKIETPEDIVVDSSGNIIVSDNFNNKIHKFSPAGVFMGSANKCTSGTGCDIINSRSTGFTCSSTTCLCTGNPCTGFFSIGSANGQYQQPTYLAIDNSNNIYISDSANDRVQKLGPTGAFLTAFGTTGSGNGQFSGSEGIAVGPTGDVFVADSGNFRVQSFNSAGTYQSQQGSVGSGDNQFAGPRGVSVDQSTGEVYVVDAGGNDRVNVYTSSLGAFSGCIGGGVSGLQSPSCTSFTSGQANSQFFSPSDVFTDSSGDSYITDTGNDRLQKTDLVSFIAKYGISGTGGGNLNSPYGVVSANGVIYVADFDNHKIQKFDTDGNFLLEWGSQGSSNGQFSFPTGVDVDSTGNVYVADAGNARIQKFTPTGTFLLSYTNGGTLCDPERVSVNPVNGYNYVADPCNGLVYVFNSVGTFQFSFSTSSGGPYGIDFDSTGNVYVVDRFFPDVEVFTSTGTPISSFGSYGTAPGQFTDPVGIAVDPVTGEIYVTDTVNGPQIFNSVYAFVAYLGPSGTGARSVKKGEANAAQDIDVGSPVLLADSDSDSIEVFDLCGNGIVEAPEECDDGNLADGDGCSATCKLQPIPEFSTVTMIIAVIGALAGIFVLRRHL